MALAVWAGLIVSDLFGVRAMNFFDIFRKPVRSFHALADNPFFQPSMEKRPVIGANNAGSYVFVAHQAVLNSVSGGGTIPTRGAPSAYGAVLSYHDQAIAAPTFNGTLVASRTLDPVMTKFERVG